MMIGLFATALAAASQPLSTELFHELQLELAPGEIRGVARRGYATCT